MNYRIYRIYSALVVLTLVGMYQIDSKASEAITLESKALALIDGVKGFMDEREIHKLIRMGRSLSELQYGKVDKATKKRIPQYQCNGKLYTLHELAKLEKELKESNKASYEKLKEPLTQVLQTIKDDFEKLSSPFIGDSAGAEQQLFDLIKESCDKRNIPESLLKTWIIALLEIRAKGIWREGIDQEVFRTYVTSLLLMDTYCTHLTNFLKDLVRSCPKGLERYRKWQAAANNSKHQK
jgi:hypothetical protein